MSCERWDVNWKSSIPGLEKAKVCHLMPREHQALSLFWYKHDPDLTLQLSWHQLNLTHLEQ